MQSFDVMLNGRSRSRLIMSILCFMLYTSNSGILISYKQQYCWDSIDAMKFDHKKPIFGGQELVQYHQHTSIEIKASNLLYKDGMIQKNRCFCEAF